MLLLIIIIIILIYFFSKKKYYINNSKEEDLTIKINDNNFSSQLDSENETISLFNEKSSTSRHSKNNKELRKEKTTFSSLKKQKFHQQFMELKNLFFNYKSLENEYKEKNDLESLFSTLPKNIKNLDYNFYEKNLKENLFKNFKGRDFINFRNDFWLKFIDNNFTEFKNILFTLINKYNILNKIKKIKINSIPINQPKKSKMENNTCFLVCMLYIIKTNSKLLELIKISCNDIIYKKCLLKLIENKDNEMISEEDFNIIINASEVEKWDFKFGQQDDPFALLEKILVEKCNLENIQFFFWEDFIVSKTGDININNIEFKNQKFKVCSSGSFLPILQLFLENNNINYNIQNILYGTKLNDNNKWYSIPLFLNAPPVLNIKINIARYDTHDIISSIPTGEIDENGKDIFINEKHTIYNFPKHGNIIFQEKIFLRSLFDQLTEYNLTSFLVCKLFPVPNIISGHYIPYYKYNGNWHCHYYDEKLGGKNILPEFPILFENNENYLITALFYERID